MLVEIVPDKADDKKEVDKLMIYKLRRKIQRIEKEKE